eukprot:1020788-Amphidinium_carterae.1
MGAFTPPGSATVNMSTFTRRVASLLYKGRLLYFHRTTGAAGINGLEALRPSPALSESLAATEKGAVARVLKIPRTGRFGINAPPLAHAHAGD